MQVAYEEGDTKGKKYSVKDDERSRKGKRCEDVPERKILMDDIQAVCHIHLDGCFLDACFSSSAIHPGNQRK